MNIQPAHEQSRAEHAAQKQLVVMAMQLDPRAQRETPTPHPIAWKATA